MAASTTKKSSPSQILKFLYLGGRSDAKSKETLDALNIRYILNCTPQRTDDPEFGCPNFFQKERNYVYKRIPIFDNKGEDIIPHMETAYKFIEEGQHYGNVLVHCHKGVSRSASFVIGYLMRKNEFTFDEALAFVQSMRPMVQPNEAFIKQLLTYNPNGNMENITAHVKFSTASQSSMGVSVQPSMSESAIDAEPTTDNTSTSSVDVVLETNGCEPQVKLARSERNPSSCETCVNQYSVPVGIDTEVSADVRSIDEETAAEERLNKRLKVVH